MDLQIYFSFLITESIKKYSLDYKLKITSSLSVFVFLNKITLLLAFFNSNLSSD